MGEYLISVMITSMLLGLFSYLSYPGASERAAKFAASVLFLYVVLMPTLSLVKKISDGKIDVGDITDGIHIENGEYGKEYEEVAKEAFTDGIRQLIFTKYGIKEENAEVFVFGFDFERMKAEKIKILLSGKGALADWRGIEDYITELGLGVCEVEIEG